jgi:hypothetical protein
LQTEENVTATKTTEFPFEGKDVTIRIGGSVIPLGNVRMKEIAGKQILVGTGQAANKDADHDIYADWAKVEAVWVQRGQN